MKNVLGVTHIAQYKQLGYVFPVPALTPDEALTVRATRSAMAKLDGDPSRLLG